MRNIRSLATSEPYVALPCALPRSGRFTLRGVPGIVSVGAIEPRGRAAFLVEAPAEGLGPIGLHLFVKSPPAE